MGVVMQVSSGSSDCSRSSRRERRLRATRASVMDSRRVRSERCSRRHDAQLLEWHHSRSLQSNP